MKLYLIFYVFAALAMTVSAIPNIIPAEQTQFDMANLLDEIFDYSYVVDEILDFYEDTQLTKRSEQTIAVILEKFNSSGILWKGLDALAESDRAIEFVANTTAKLIESTENSISLSGIISASSALHLNISGTVRAVEDSGLITSVLDGILLDENYRPVLVNLTERIVYPNLDVIYYFMEKYLYSSSNKKRSTTSGSLQTFATNILATVLQSNLVKETSVDLLNALNDTGIAVYTIKRLIADETYQNLTVKLAKDIYDTGAISMSFSNLNLTSLIDKTLDDPTLITGALGSLLSGNGGINGITSFLGKYTSAFDGLIDDLQSNGFFVTLNNYFFSTTTEQATTKANNKDIQATAKLTSVSTSNSASTKSEKLASNSAKSNKPIIKCLLALQSILFGGSLLLI